MTNECRTTRKRFYKEEQRGEVVFREGAMTTVERTEGQLTVKIRTTKKMNWLELADSLEAEVGILSVEMQEQSFGCKTFADIQPQVFSEECIIERMEDDGDGDDPNLFCYFYDARNWVMYENDDEYLFLYEYQEHEGQRNSVDDFADSVADEAWYILGFLRNWYYRCMGFPEEK